MLSEKPRVEEYYVTDHNLVENARIYIDISAY